MSVRPSQAITTAVSFAISFSFLDLWASMSTAPASKVGEPATAAALLGTGFVAGCLVYAVAWLGVTRPVVRWRALEPVSAGLATASLLLCVAALARFGVAPSGRAVQQLVALTLLGAACLGPAVLVYRAARYAKSSESHRDLPEAVVFVAPALWMLLFGFLWTRAFADAGAGRIALAAMTLALPLIPLAPLAWVRVRRPWIEAAVLGSLALALFAGLVSAIASMRPPSLAPAAETDRSHGIARVVLISIDTLRADSLSCYGGRGNVTPSYDALAADGVRFTNAVSPAPWTLPAVASIMTGLPPSAHTATDYSSRLPDSVRTLAERLREQGYATAAVVNNYFVGSEVNLAQGFDEFREFPKHTLGRSVGARLLRRSLPEWFREDASTAELSRLAVEWLEGHAERDFFLWVHYYDPHEPYDPPKQFRPPPPAPPRIGWRLRALGQIHLGLLQPTAEEMAWIRKLYDAEVRYVDQGVGEIVAALKRLGLYDGSLILVVSDHGEEFWEHGRIGHGHTLYQEVLRVPLIVK
ncbi:MAG: sulfatase, partial [Candidatus Binatia bacterium]